MFIRKAIRFLAVILIFSILCAIPAFAHTNSQEGILAEEYISDPDYMDYYIGGEAIGWFINEKCHSGSASISYRFDEAEPETEILFQNGAAMWSEVATFYESSGSANCVQDYEFGRDDIVAQYTGYVYINDPTGHVVYWNIAFNTDDGNTYDAVSAAHELGHAIGLTDLHTATNLDKIMYYSNAGTATAPTDSDLWGARVILGLHTTHTFEEYRYCGQDANGNHRHVKYCSECNGSRAIKTVCLFSDTEPLLGCLHCGYNPYLA